jgi:hypothetical protein
VGGFLALAANSPRLTALRAAADRCPSDAFPRYALALELKSLGETQEAWTHLVALLDEQPDYLPGYAAAGDLARILGYTVRARALFERGVEIASRKGDQHTAQRLRDALDALSEER